VNDAEERLHFGPISVEIDAPLARVRFSDRANGNTFQPEWIKSLVAAMKRATSFESVKVIIAAGTPEVFCAGATKETLLGISDQLPVSQYSSFARVFATCPLPVVAEMQGHALGGGLVFGLYADVCVLSERSIYAANFMQYGVAPYIGATHVIPARLGVALGTEMLLTARGYRGRELRERACGPQVVPHGEVPSVSENLALAIARAPRASLELLKRELSAHTLAETDKAMKRELRPHLASRRLGEVRLLAETRYGHGLLSSTPDRDATLPVGISPTRPRRLFAESVELRGAEATAGQAIE
jgi:polyketide biosynthesis enoyl-CoA hydratase PksI